MSFNLSLELTAQMNMASLRNVQAQVKSAVSDVKGTINFQVDQRSLAQVRQLSGSLQDLQANIKALQAASSVTAASVGQVTAALSGVSNHSRTAATGMQAAAASARQTAAAAREAGDGFAEFGRQVGLSARRFVAFNVASGALSAVSRALRTGIKDAIEFDSSLNRLQQVSGETADQVRGVGTEVMRLSTNLGASSKDLMEAAVTLKQAGLATNDVKKALEGIAQASLAPSFASMKQITEGAVASFQQFGKNVDNLRDQLGAVNSVSADFAVEASDLVTAIQKAGGTAAQTGAQFNELLAVFTSIRATTRESADSIATGLRTIFTRLQRNDTVESLKALGINLRYVKGEADALGDGKLEGQFVGMYEAVRRVSEGLSKIRTTEPRFSAAIEELGGYRQVSRVIPLIQQFSEAQKALNVARLGSASLEAAAAIRQDALATKFAKTRESFQQLVNELVQTRGFKNTVDVALNLAGAFTDVVGAVKPLIPLIATLGAVKLGTGLVSFGRGVRDAFTAPVGGSIAPPVSRSRFRFASGDFVPGHGNQDTVDAKLTPGEFVIRKAAAQRLGARALKHMNETGELPRGYNRGGPVLRYAGGGPAPDINAAIERVLGRMNVTGDARQDAALRLLQRAAAGNLPSDPAELDRYLAQEARRGVRNSYRREERYRSRFIPGATNAAGRPVVDVTAARDAMFGEPEQLYSSGLLSHTEEVLARGNANGNPLYASTLGKRRTEELLQVAMANGDLTTEEASRILGRPIAPPKPVTPTPAPAPPPVVIPPSTRSAALVGASTSAPAAAGTYALAPVTGGSLARVNYAMALFGSGGTGRGRHVPGLGEVVPDAEYRVVGGPGGFPPGPPLPPRALGAGNPFGDDPVRAYQEAQLAAARARYGDTYGVPEDEVRANRREGRAQARQDVRAYDREQRRRAERDANGGAGSPLLAHFGDTREVRRANQRGLGVPFDSMSGTSDADRRWRLMVEASGHQVAMARHQRDGLLGPAELRYQANAMAAISAAANDSGTNAGNRLLRRAAERGAAVDPAQAAELAARANPATPLSSAQFLAANRGKVSAENLFGGYFLAGGGYPNLDWRSGNVPRRPVDRRGFHEWDEGIYWRPESRSENEQQWLKNNGVVTRSAADIAARDFSRAGLQTVNLNDHIKNRTDEAIAAAGGPKMLSAQTMARIAEEQHTKVVEESTVGLKRQILTDSKGIAAAEAELKAREMVQKALAENASVLRNAAGKVVGSTALGTELALQGASVTGRGGVGGFLATRAGAVGRGLSSVAERVGGLGPAGTYAFMGLAPIIGEQFGPGADEYKTAAATGNTSGLRTRSATAGALGMAATGAGIGLMLGPPGSAVGAVVGGVLGGVVGLAQGLSQADKEIREARVGEALTKLTDSLQTASGHLRDAAAISSSDLGDQLSTIRREIEGKATEAAGRSWYNPRGWFVATDPAELAAARTRETRVALGGQAGAAISVLSRQAERVARENPNAKTADLAKQFGADPVTSALLRVVADVRGVPVGKVLREFAESIETAQRQIRAQAAIEQGRQAAEQSAAALSRLADAVQNAALSTHQFETSLAAVSAAFAGQGGAVRVGAGLPAGFAQFGSGTGVEFGQSAAVLAATLGPAATGFVRRATAADQVSRELPAVLQAIGHDGGGTDDAISSRARGVLQDRLLPGLTKDQQAEALKANPELQAAITSALGELTHANNNNKDGGLAKRLREDPAKVFEEITARFNGPVKEAWEQMGRAVTEHAQKYVDELAHARTMFAAAGESLDRVADVRLAGQRVRADIAADRTGRNATDLLSLRDLDAPFQGRQERLTGFRGEAALDPAAIAARLREVTGRAAGVAAARDAARGDKDEFARRAAELDGLTGEAAHLQTALRNLANASERAAGIQEKLNAATANRDSRLSYAERFITASPEQQMRMRRGQDVVAQVDRGAASFNSLSDDEKRLFIETTNDLGQTRLRSGRTAAGLKEQTLGGVPGVLDPGQERERQGLQDQLGEVFRTGEAAQQALANFQRGTYATFLTQLKGLHEQFFARLATNMATTVLAGLKARETAEAAHRGELGQQDQLRQLFVRLGTNPDDKDSVKNLQGMKGDIDEYLKLNRTIQSKRQEPALGSGARAAIDAGVQKFSKLAGVNDPTGELYDEAGSTAALRDILAPHGLENLDEKAQGAALFSVKTRFYQAWNRNPDQYGTQDAQAGLLEQLAREELAAGRDATVARLEKSRGETGQRLTDHGVKASALNGLSETDEVRLKEGLANTGLSFASLGDDIRKADVALADLTAQIRAAEEALRQAQGREPGRAPEPFVFAAGGSVFKPKGTDTVPAMLTPGEFVVNAKSAAAHRDILEHINRAKGPSDAGLVADGDDRKKRIIRGILNTYEDVRQGMSSAANWLGLADGGEVPQYRADGGVIVLPGLTPEQLARRKAREKARRTARGTTTLFGGVVPGVVGGLALTKERERRMVTLSDPDGAPAMTRAAARADQELAARSKKRWAFSPTEALGAEDRARFAKWAKELREKGETDRADAIEARLRKEARAYRGDQWDQDRLAERLLAANDRMNATSMAYQQALVRGGGLPGEEGQIQAAVAAVAEQRDVNNRAFADRFGKRTYFQQAARVGATFQTVADQAAEHRRRAALGFYDRPASRTRTKAPGAPFAFAGGGRVPGSGSGDSVPAMLTPGEYVFSRPAVQALGEGALDKVHRFARGGLVGNAAYLADGGLAAAPGAAGMLGLDPETKTALAGFFGASKELTKGMEGFGTHVSTFAQGVGTFGASVDKFVSAVSKIPTEMSLQGNFTTNVNLNGADAFQGLEDKFRAMMVEYVAGAIGAEFQARLPDAPGRFRSNAWSRLR